MCHKRSNNISLYTCSTCNQSFVNKSLYKAHQKTHTVDKTYHCTKCYKIFFKEVSLIAHQCTNRALFEKMITEPVEKTSSHSSGKKYKCSKCDAFFSSSQSRNTHMKMHADGMYSSMVRNTVYFSILQFNKMPPIIHPSRNQGSLFL